MIHSYVAVNPTNEEPISTKNLQIPFEWMIGTVIAIAIPTGIIVLWMGKLRSDIDGTKQDLKDHKEAQNKERQSDRASFTAELKISRQEIIHQFELFAQRFQISMDNFNEKLTNVEKAQCRKDETVNHIRNDLEKVKASERETAKYLDSLRPYLPGVDRRDGGSVSGSVDYR
jgi:hypothetical protein